VRQQADSEHHGGSPRRPALLLTLLLVSITACSGNPPSGEAARATDAAAPTSRSSLPTRPLATSRPSPTGPIGYRPLPGDQRVIGFEPTSVSFVSVRTGWFLGTSVCGTGRCGALLQTRDTGHTFTRRSAPPVHVAQVRFANLDEGWAFGNDATSTKGDPGLWRTHDGGRTWRHVLATPVPALETGNGSVWAVELDSGGTTPRLFRGSALRDELSFAAQIPNRSATLVVGHGTAYVVAQQGAGPVPTVLVVVAPDGTHQHANPCQGNTTSLQIAVGRPQHLLAICSGESSAGAQLKAAFASSDNGSSWHRRPDPPDAGYTLSLQSGGVAATSSSIFVTGPRSAINKEVGDGPWRPVLPDEGGTGFTYVGFTDDSHGVAISRRAAWMTDTSGEHWRRLALA
jgi:photosystem II stability/assembly factor-like uncharacterized protein